MKVMLHGVFAILLCVSGVGCASIRHATMVDVVDIGDKITTKYRYYCVGTSQEDFRRWLEEGAEDIEWSPGSYRIGGKSIESQNKLELSNIQPNVFSKGGIPILVAERTIGEERWGKSDAARLGWFVFYMCTAGLLPVFPNGSETEKMFSVAIASDKVLARQLVVKERRDEIVSLFTPLAFLFYHGRPTFKGNEKSKVFSKTVCSLGAGGCSTGIEALAYGLAVKLKELEDAGEVTDDTMQSAALLHRRHGEAKRNSLLKKALNQSSLAINCTGYAVDRVQDSNVLPIKPVVQTVNAYTLDRFVWDSDRDYACSFALKMNGECTIEAFSSIENEFREHVRNAFLKSHPSVDARFLIVDVRPSVDKGKVVGTAAVLTIKPVSMAYDAKMRQGKISVRFGPGQYEEARAWARKNIETLARDKNLVLVTGQLPPEARYYSLGETVKDGNVLEIEFRTE